MILLTIISPISNTLVQALSSFKLCVHKNDHESLKRKGWKIVTHIIALRAA